MNNIKNRKTETFLWIVLFSILSVSAVFLASFYVYMMIDSTDFNVNDELKYKLWSASPSEYRYNSVNQNSLTPELVYFQNENGGAALLNNESLTKEYYNDLKHYISEGFTENSIETYTSDERSIIEKTILSSSCVYFEFSSELPLYIYLYYMGNSLPSELSENASCMLYVDSFFIVRQTDGSGYYIVAMSDDIIITTGSVTDTDFPSAVTDSVIGEVMKSSDTKFLSASFAGNTYEDEKFPLRISVNEDVYVSKIVVSDKFDIRSDKNSVTSVLSLFGYNPDKVSKYKESNDVDVYVETFGLLKLSQGSIIFEASSGDGIDPADYTLVDEEASLFDMLCVSDGFISSVAEISQSFLGGSAVPRLYSVRYENDALYVTYMYYYDNVFIENAVAAEFCFSNGIMTETKIYSVNIEDSLSRDILTGSGLLYKLYYGKYVSELPKFRLVYVLNNDIISNEWLIYD